MKIITWRRLFAMIKKEFIQMYRDRGTLAMILGIPLMQILLFGYAVNSNPKHLPTVLVNGDHSYLTRHFITALQNTDYFDVINPNTTTHKSENMLATGKAQFIISIPPDFTHDWIRGLQPKLLVTADATDPAATLPALSALQGLSERVFNIPLQRGFHHLSPKPPPFHLMVHAKYNPENITQYQIVPGLIGVVLTMTLSMITTVAITKEHERGTMEGLLSTPVRPLEVMLGKISPYIITGYLQQLLIIGLAIFLFHVPSRGSLLLLMAATLPFILANLIVGTTFSTFAKNQLQAVQMTMFYFLPSLLLSGFMFPFYGMPRWAQMIGNVLPLTHFLRIVRGIMLKGNGIDIVVWQMLPIILFGLVAMGIGLKRYRRTLD